MHGYKKNVGDMYISRCLADGQMVSRCANGELTVLRRLDGR